MLYTLENGQEAITKRKAEAVGEGRGGEKRNLASHFLNIFLLSSVLVLYYCQILVKTLLSTCRITLLLLYSPFMNTETINNWFSCGVVGRW